MKIKKIIYSLIAFCILAQTACVKDKYDTSNIGSIQPTLGIPVLNAQFQLKQFLPSLLSSPYISVDSTKAIQFSLIER